MAEDSTLTNPTGGAEPAGSSAAPGIDPEQYAQLVAYYQQTAPLVQKISPYIDDVTRYADDEDYRQFTRRAYDSYQASIKAQEPEIPEPVRYLEQRMNERLDPVVEYVKDLRGRETRAQEQAQREAMESNMAYAQRLAAENPHLAEDNYAGIQMLASYAGSRNISLEEAYKRRGSIFGAAAAKAEPPTSLRSSAAAPGIPGPSEQPKAVSRNQIRQRLADNLRSAGFGKGA